MCVQGSQKCPGLKEMLRWNPSTQSDVARRRKFATNSQPRRSNNKATLFSVNLTINFL